VRYPRGSGPGTAIEQAMTAIPVGRAQLRRSGRGVAILAFGSMVPVALAAGEALDATVVNMRFVKPLDTALVLDMAARHDLLVTIEENVVAGGAGAAVAEALAAADRPAGILHIGYPDRFVDQGDQQQLLASIGLDTDSVIRVIRERLAGRRIGAAPLAASA